MADFCKQCVEETFGVDHSDFAFTTGSEVHYHVLCEGCGPGCIVDFTGTCIAIDCYKRHGLHGEKNDDIVMQENAIVQELRADDSYGDSLSNPIQDHRAD